mgnify:CR=1 FL=1|tara:strand:- start:314 stop:1060 length:747 start_codon:yes stop_codon:yes gene_type:complete
MKVLLLAAGYSTRLYPLTKNFPKPLLEIANKPVITYIIEKLEGLKEIKEIYVVTNNKFYQHFLDWKFNLNTKLKIEVLNDGTLSEDDKLGANGDINFVINKKNIREPLLILGGDNLFDFNLNEMVDYFKNKGENVVSLAEEKNLELLKQLNSITLDENNKITFLVEKPEKPSSTLYVNCIYIYTKETVQLYKTYLDQKNNPDQPGHFLQWLYPQKDVYGFLNKGNIIDIGTHETLEKARREFISSSSA